MSEARKAPSGPGQGAENEPWWSHLLTEYAAGATLRALARQFGTSPRRIRRAMARTGVRVHGRQLSNRGVPELVTFLSRLGKEPDAAIARAAGVTPEAVAGERHRLGLAPFRPARKPVLTRDDEAWIRGPVRRRREKVDLEADLLVVRRTLVPEPRGSLVRRPGSPAPATSRAPDASARPPAAPSPRPAEVAEPRSFRGPAAVVVLRAGVDGAARVPGREAEPFVPAVRQANSSATARAFFEERERRQRELDELLNAPRRERDQSRSRIVRSGEQRLLDPGVEPPREPAQRRTRSDSPAWRPVDPEALRRLEAEAEHVAEVAAAEASRRAAAEAATAPPPARVDAGSSVRVHVPSPPQPRPRVPSTPAPTPTAEPAPAPALRRQAASTAIGFRVWFGGLGDPVEVDAGDVVGAIEAAQRLLPAWPFEIVGVERSG